MFLDSDDEEHPVLNRSSNRNLTVLRSFSLFSRAEEYKRYRSKTMFRRIFTSGPLRSHSLFFVWIAD